MRGSTSSSLAFGLFSLGLIFTSCVTEPVEPDRPAYSYTVINDSKVEPFVDSGCVERSEYGYTRIGIGYENVNSIFVCSGAPLRKLGPYRYAADPGYPMAVALKDESGNQFPVVRTASEEQAYILDYNTQAGIRIFYPLGRQSATGGEPVYLNLVGQTIECEQQNCKMSPKWICVATKEDFAKYQKYVANQNDSSPFKTMNERNLALAREAGCFN